MHTNSQMGKGLLWPSQKWLRSGDRGSKALLNSPKDVLSKGRPFVSCLSNKAFVITNIFQTVHTYVRYFWEKQTLELACFTAKPKPTYHGSVSHFCDSSEGALTCEDADLRIVPSNRQSLQGISMLVT